VVGRGGDRGSSRGECAAASSLFLHSDIHILWKRRESERRGRRRGRWRGAVQRGGKLQLMFWTTPILRDGELVGGCRRCQSV